MATATKYKRLGSNNPASDDEAFEKQFQTVSRIIYDSAGIALTDKKQELVRSRLTRRFRELGLANLGEYVDLVSGPNAKDELPSMIDALTTNKTFFFRESAHFDYLVDTVIPNLPPGHQELRVWSAGCSSGEEAYSLAMVLKDTLGRKAMSFRILATDICAPVLATAKAGVYPNKALDSVPQEYQKRFLRKVQDPASGADAIEVTPELRKSVSFGRLNLMGEWPMKGPFDCIFCRNVMIYFDKETRNNLVKRYWRLLRPGGYLFIGHSETLGTEDLGYRFIQPAVYQK